MTETKTKGRIFDSTTTVYWADEDLSPERALQKYPATKVLREICNYGEGAEEYMEKICSQRSYSAKDVVRILQYIFKNPNQYSFNWFLAHWLKDSRFPTVEHVLDSYFYFHQNRASTDWLPFKDKTDRTQKAMWDHRVWRAFQDGFGYDKTPDKATYEKWEEWESYKNWTTNALKNTELYGNNPKFQYESETTARKLVDVTELLKILEVDGVEELKNRLEGTKEYLEEEVAANKRRFDELQDELSKLDKFKRKEETDEISL